MGKARPRGKPCAVCISERRAEVDAAIFTGEAYGKIAKKFGLFPGAVGNHARKHMKYSPQEICNTARITAAVETASETLENQIAALQARTLDRLAQAETGEDHRAVAALIREARSNIETLGRLAGRLADLKQVNIQNNLTIQAEPQYRLSRLTREDRAKFLELLTIVHDPTYQALPTAHSRSEYSLSNDFNGICSGVVVDPGPGALDDE